VPGKLQVSYVLNVRPNLIPVSYQPRILLVI